MHKSVYKKLKEYYCYKGKGYEEWMLPMFLLPQGVFVADKGFNCCQTCVKMLNTSTQPYHVKLPKYAIANGAIIGDAPVKLKILNDVELVLVSIACIDKHIFTFYGGAHKSMCGWHNSCENDFEHIAGALQQIKSLSGSSTAVGCILHGPFTVYQLTKVKEQVMICPQKILKAMKWLKWNNHMYKGLAYPPRVKDLPEPIIINDSKLMELENTQIESQFEYTVICPSTNEINSTNGENMTQEAFKCQVIQNMDRSNTALVYAQMTQN